MINPSNTSLSTYKGNRHRKFDAKQKKRNNYGKAHCVSCDKVFTKYHWSSKNCSRECSIKNKKAVASKYQKNNRGIINKRRCEHRLENHERMLERDNKIYEKNREKILSDKRKRYAKNPDKFNTRSREYYAKKKLQKQKGMKKWRNR